MPIEKPPGLKLLQDAEFKQVTYDVMQEVFKLHITALGSELEAYSCQLRRFLAHARIETIQWVNIGRKEVTFRTIRK